MLVAMRMTGNAENSLDNALTSTLIPQLENLPLAALGACEALYNKSVVKYFKDAYKSPNRQSYSDAFEKVMKYLQVTNYKELSEQFANGILKIEDTTNWTTIEAAVQSKGEGFPSDLFQFTSAIVDLKKSAVV
jgi:hypothetical protein